MPVRTSRRNIDSSYGSLDGLLRDDYSLTFISPFVPPFVSPPFSRIRKRTALP